MVKEIKIYGCVEVQPEVSMDSFVDEFIKWIESKGWSFGGGFNEIIDGAYIKPDGSYEKPLMKSKSITDIK